MNWTAVGIVGALVTSIIGPLIALYQARKADKSAMFTETMKVGVTSLVDQLQEEVHDCRGECEKLRREVERLRAEVEQARKDVEKYLAVIDDREATIIRLKRQAGAM